MIGFLSSSERFWFPCLILAMRHNSTLSEINDNSSATAINDARFLNDGALHKDYGLTLVIMKKLTMSDVDGFCFVIPAKFSFVDHFNLAEFMFGLLHEDHKAF